MSRKETQYEEWLKPRTWPLRLSQGVDFTCEPKALAVALQEYARRKGIGARVTVLFDDQTVTVRRI